MLVFEGAGMKISIMQGKFCMSHRCLLPAMRNFTPNSVWSSSAHSALHWTSWPGCLT